jgi:hypothetical protein
MHGVYRVVTAFKFTIRTKASILSILPYEISNSRFVTEEALSREKSASTVTNREFEISYGKIYICPTHSLSDTLLCVFACVRQKANVNQNSP